VLLVYVDDFCLVCMVVFDVVIDNVDCKGGYVLV